MSYLADDAFAIHADGNRGSGPTTVQIPFVASQPAGVPIAAAPVVAAPVIAAPVIAAPVVAAPTLIPAPAILPPPDILQPAALKESASPFDFATLIGLAAGGLAAYLLLSGKKKGKR